MIGEIPISDACHYMDAHDTETAARARGGILSQDEVEQLQYADMLIDVSKNLNSSHCQVIEVEDDNVSKLGLPIMQYFTEAEYDSAVEWLYPGR